MLNPFVFPYQQNQHYRFNLWAPKAASVSIVFKGTEEKIALESTEFGYWSLSTDIIPESARYKYLLDNKDSYPDLASLSQPDGVHGWSEIIDIGNFPWNDRNWKNLPLQDMIMYELHTGTFTPMGNFAGIRSKLDYFLELGINTIEILPVSQFSGHRNWGYDGVYPFAVHNTYGGAKE